MCELLINLDEVLRLSESIQDPSSIEWVWMSAKFMIVIALFFVIGGCVLSAIEDNYMHIVYFLAIGLFVNLCASGVITLNSEEQQEHAYNNQVAYWKKHYAQPYIESLPSQKRVVDFMQVQQLEGNNIDSEPLHYFSTQVLPDSVAIASIQYTDHNKTIEQQAYYHIKRDLKEGQRPMVEGKILEQDLGHGVSSGIYNGTLHVTADFEL